MRHFLISLCMTNCFIQIMCNIKSKSYTLQSSELIDDIDVDKGDIEGVLCFKLFFLPF